jgi:predicted nucleic acid-binding protein
MKLVVDANIVISGMITAHGVVGELLLRTYPPLELHGPENLRIEVSKYREKIARAARLSVDEVAYLEEQVLAPVRIMPDLIVPPAIWERAFDLVRSIDEDDVQFIAVAMFLNCPLWTGDKKLVGGLRRKGFKLLLTSDELRKQLGA